MINYWPGQAIRKTVGIALVLLQVSSVSCYAEVNGKGNEYCYAGQTDEWLVAFYNRVRTHDKLFQYALKNYGEPDSCVGNVTAEFDGKKYGSIKFVWGKVRSFSVSTMPPESSIIKLESKYGFSNAAAVRHMLEQYTRGLGLTIDWTDAVKNVSETGVIETFTAKPVGMNIHVRLHYNTEKKLTGIIISMAL